MISLDGVYRCHRRSCLRSLPYQSNMMIILPHHLFPLHGSLLYLVTSYFVTSCLVSSLLHFFIFSPYSLSTLSHLRHQLTYRSFIYALARLIVISTRHEMPFGLRVRPVRGQTHASNPTLLLNTRIRSWSIGTLQDNLMSTLNRGDGQYREGRLKNRDW